MLNIKEKAMEAYPKQAFPNLDLDLNELNREAFVKGYRQALKDNCIIWEDAKEICEAHGYCARAIAEGREEQPKNEAEYWRKVLARFIMKKGGEL